MNIKLCDDTNNALNLDYDKEYTVSELLKHHFMNSSALKEEPGRDDLEVFRLLAFLSNITEDSVEKHYYLGVGSDYFDILSELDQEDIDVTMDILNEAISAAVGDEVEFVKSDTEAKFDEMEFMYDLSGYATNFSEDRSSLDVYGVLRCSGILDDLGERSFGLPVEWDMSVELPPERIRFIVSHMGTALETCGMDDNSAISKLCEKYWNNK